MPIFNKQKKSVFFAHIPKCGGSSIKLMFTDSGWSCEKYNDRADGHLNQHATSEEFLQWDNLPEEKFTIIRNPFTRLISDILFHRRTSHPNMTLENYIQEILTLNENVNKLHNHLRPQTEFITKDMQIYVFETKPFSLIQKKYQLNKCIHENKNPNYPSIKIPSEYYQLICSTYQKDFEVYERVCLDLGRKDLLDNLNY